MLIKTEPPRKTSAALFLCLQVLVVGFKSLNARNQVSDDVLRDGDVFRRLLRQVFLGVLGRMQDVVKLVMGGSVVMLFVSVVMIVMSMGHSQLSS